MLRTWPKQLLGSLRLALAIDIESPQIDCLKFVMCPQVAPIFQGFFAAAINSTNEANKAGGMCH